MPLGGEGGGGKRLQIAISIKSAQRFNQNYPDHDQIFITYTQTKVH